VENEVEDEDFSSKIFIDELINLSLDKGFMISHNQGKSTYIKKHEGDFKESYDLSLLPPIVVKNALPCEIYVLGTQVTQEGIMHSEYEG